MEKCRGCLKVFAEGDRIHSLNCSPTKELFAACTGIEVNPAEDAQLPNSICFECHRMCTTFTKFKSKCVVVTQYLKKQLNNKKINPFNLLHHRSLRDVEQYDVNILLKKEPNFENEYEFNRKRRRNTKIKIEPNARTVKAMPAEIVVSDDDQRLQNENNLEKRKIYARENILNKVPWEVADSDDGDEIATVQKMEVIVNEIPFEIESSDDGVDTENSRCLKPDYNVVMTVVIDDDDEEDNVNSMCTPIISSNINSFGAESPVIFDWDTRLESHNTKTNESSTNNNDFVSCSECDHLLLPEEIKSHFQRIDHSEQWTCERCLYTTNNNCLIAQHKKKACLIHEEDQIEQHHSSTSLISTQSKCPICHILIPQVNSSSHMKSHSIKRETFYCGQCDRNVDLKIKKKHMETHKPAELDVCVHCKCAFQTPADLREHIISQICSKTSVVHERGYPRLIENFDDSLNSYSLAVSLDENSDIIMYDPDGED